MTLGEKIQGLRKSKGMSQEELAEKLEVSRQSISKWELNDSVPDISKIILLSDYFGVSTDYLLKDSEKGNRDSQKNYVEAKVLFITSVIFVAIGLFIAIGGWEDTQKFESIAVGFIIQSVGIAAIMFGKAICPSQSVSANLKFANLALLSFMPVSIIADIIKGYPIGPYPITPPEVFLFIIIYGIIIVIGTVLIITQSRSKHSKSI